MVNVFLNNVGIIVIILFIKLIDDLLIILDNVVV